jgi:hypothetical protein
MKFTSAFATLLLSASTILAAPVEFTPRDVWVPKILSPGATTVWQVGKTYNVTWSLDQKPENVTNPNGTVYLSKNGRLNISAFPSLYLFGWTETDNPLIFLFSPANPLAKGFKLTDASVPVTIPGDTVPGADYAVVRTYRSLPRYTIGSIPCSFDHSFIHSFGRFREREPHVPDRRVIAG